MRRQPAVSRRAQSEFASPLSDVLYFVGHLTRWTMPPMTKPTVALRLNEDTQERLKALGQRRDRSPHYLMKEAVETYLEAQEALEAERDLMTARWERFELTGETVAHDDIKAWANGLSTPDDNPRS